MQHQLEERTRLYSEARRKLKKRKWWTSLTAVFVALLTLYGLLLPAQTLELTTYCGLDHEHTDQCFSNPDADTETEAVWVATLPQQEVYAANNVAVIARSQIGYKESIHNYLVEEDTHYGYSRYGAWAGTPYAEWNTLFAEFCLNYSGMTIPHHDTAEEWAALLTNEGQLVNGDPTVGDIAFFLNNNGTTRCGIVVETAPVTVIAGDVNNQVESLTFEAGDAALLGYQKLPEGAYEPVQAAEEPEEAEEPVEDEGTEEESEDPVEDEGTEEDSEDPEVLLAHAEDGRSYEFSLNDPAVSVTNIIEELGVAEDTVYADASDALVADIEQVEFSAPEALSVSKIEELDDWMLISMQPFYTEETLTVTMNDGDVFTIALTDGQLEKTFISASGEAWNIKLTYFDNCGIPEGAELSVSELSEADEGYAEYLLQSEQALGAKAGTSSYVRVFDISILDAEGQKVEPAANVQVEISLTDEEQQAKEDAVFNVVHFGETTEVLDSENKAEDGAQVITFETDSFSVYVVEKIKPDPIKSDLGYNPSQIPEEFAIVPQRYSNGSQVAMQHDFTQEPVQNYGYTNNPDLWTFVPGDDGKYYIKEKDGNNYIAVGPAATYSDSCSYLSSVPSIFDAAQFTVQQGNDGIYYIYTINEEGQRLFLNKTPDVYAPNSYFQFWNVDKFDVQNPLADEGNHFYLSPSKDISDKILTDRSYAIIDYWKYDNTKDGAMSYNNFGWTEVTRKDEYTYTAGTPDLWSFMPLPDGSYLIKQANGNQYIGYNGTGATIGLQLVDIENALHFNFEPYAVNEGDGVYTNGYRIYTNINGVRYDINKNGNNGYWLWNGFDNGSVVFLCQSAEKIDGNTYAIIPDWVFKDGGNDHHGAIKIQWNGFLDDHDDVDTPNTYEAYAYTRAAGRATEWTFILRPDGKYIIKESPASVYLRRWRHT